MRMQAFKSESRALAVTSLEKLPFPQGRAGGGGSGWYHPAPSRAASQCLLLPYSTTCCFPPPPLLLFPLLHLFLLLKSPLLCPRAIRDHSEIPLKHHRWHSGLRTPCITWRVLAEMWGMEGKLLPFCQNCCKCGAFEKLWKCCQHPVACLWNIRPLEGVKLKEASWL